MCACALAAERKGLREYYREMESQYNGRVKVYCEVCDALWKKTIMARVPEDSRH
jgi:hypothetical protein